MTPSRSSSVAASLRPPVGAATLPGVDPDRDKPSPDEAAAGIPVDLRADGLLWLINASVFHPRGFALGYAPDAPVEERFRLLGDGSEAWQFSPTLAPTPDELLAAVEDLFTRARAGWESR